MDNPNDVTTLERWLPTTLSKTLLLCIPTTGIGTFLTLRPNLAWFGLELLNYHHQTIICLLASLLLPLLCSWLLIAELIHIVNFKKHRILTFNYAQPKANFVFVIVAVIIFCLGYYAATP